jgi:hypothetical protein
MILNFLKFVANPFFTVGYIDSGFWASGNIDSIRSSCANININI